MVMDKKTQARIEAGVGYAQDVARRMSKPGKIAERLGQDEAESVAMAEVLRLAATYGGDDKGWKPFCKEACRKRIRHACRTAKRRWQHEEDMPADASIRFAAREEYEIPVELDHRAEQVARLLSLGACKEAVKRDLGLGRGEMDRIVTSIAIRLVEAGYGPKE